MTELYNLLSWNGTYGAPWDTACLVVGDFKCSKENCDIDSGTMLYIQDLSGEVKCEDDNASCVLDADRYMGIMIVYGTNSSKLIINSITFKDGEIDYGGGVEIHGGAVVDLILCAFSGCKATGTNETNGDGGGAIYVYDSETIVNVYGTSFAGNTAALYGDDVYNWGDANITIHNTCPSPFSLNDPIEGSALDTYGPVDGYAYSYSGCTTSSSDNTTPFVVIVLTIVLLLGVLIFRSSGLWHEEPSADKELTKEGTLPAISPVSTEPSTSNLDEEILEAVEEIVPPDSKTTPDSDDCTKGGKGKTLREKVKYTREEIDPMLLIDSKELIFERDDKGTPISLGRGAFGTVLIADHHGTRCAYKEIIPAAISDDTLKRFFLELEIIGHLRHPNIVQCIGVVWEPKEHGIMFELCKNGGLDDFQKKYEKLHITSWGEDEAVTSRADKLQTEHSVRHGTVISTLIDKGVGIKTEWAIGIARGCSFLHAKHPPIIHRDLKGSNVLVSNDLTAKITDFGESREVGGENENTMTATGTPYFMAPEVYNADVKLYSTAVDIYSFGILLLEIFYDGDIKRAFKKGWGPMVVMHRVLKGWRPDLKAVEEEDKGLAVMMSRCWEEDPNKRPSFEELLKFFEKKQNALRISEILASGELMKELDLGKKNLNSHRDEITTDIQAVATKPRAKTGTG
eukprot:CAMPEP_0118654858 /NCGR_PEP_ID=MMETSP0785-20121206/12615_1 /TAXON_ID=91992 /ORGANISM="Bolidomonas pacifica, Strain CCMP 1866" /LENGTH=682 /DNA_ID=CAMNT_0006547549 /DNA_START=299 /DNA_END=2344 /DNA_ORIENTATION=-